MSRPQPRLHTEGELPYLLSAPARPSATPALLCFLHGYDEGQPTPVQEGLTRHGPLRPASAPLAVEEFVVIAPQLPTRGDLWHRHADAVRTIVQAAQARHFTDPNRTYLTGFSFGGNGVFDLGAAQPDLWHALWPVDPTRVPKLPLRQPIWLSSGQISRRAEQQFVQQLALAPPIPAPVTGDRIYVDQGQDHVGTATLAYQDDRIYRWLLTHRRNLA